MNCEVSHTRVEKNFVSGTWLSNDRLESLNKIRDGSPLQFQSEYSRKWLKHKSGKRSVLPVVEPRRLVDDEVKAPRPLSRAS
jgi:hypothetical protein